MAAARVAWRLVALVRVAAGCSDFAAGWRVCRDAGRGCVDPWPSPPLPTTALAALLAGPRAAETFATPPAFRDNETVVDPYYGANLEALRDVNATGRAFYTMRWERRLDDCGDARRLEIPGVNYRATVSADGVDVPSLDAFGGMFARRRYDLPRGADAVAIVVAPPDHVGFPTCANPNATCGQGGDHQLARDVTAQFTLGWDWQQAIPDRSTGFFGTPTLRDARAVSLRDPAVLTAAVACEDATDGCGASSDATLLAVARVENFGDAVAQGTVTVAVAGKDVALVPYFVTPGGSVDLRTAVNVSDVDLWWPRGATENEVALHVASFRLGDETTPVVFGCRTFSTFVDAATGGRAFRVNGREIFLRGGNWIATDAMWRYSGSRRRYSDEVALHAAAGLNLIRVWGGGVAESDLFFRECDAAGVLVYQEFWMTGDNNGRWAGSYDWPDDHGAYAVAVFDRVENKNERGRV